MTSGQKTWKLLEMLNWTTDYLNGKGFENARLNAERLLGHALGLRRVDLYLCYDRPLSPEEVARFKALLQRRLQHEPLQYIIGSTEFMSLPFRVNRNVLIPRPETEVLVERVIERCKTKFSHRQAITILDIGTGSGNIAVSLAKFIESAQVTAVDINESILAVARDNAALNGIAEKVHFIEADVLKPDFPAIVDSKFDVIVSNPPYILPQDFERLPEEIRLYEPGVALRDGAEGLAFYRQVAELAHQLLQTDGFIAVEIGLGQRENVVEIFRTRGFDRIEVFRDFNRIERVVLIGK